MKKNTITRTKNTVSAPYLPYAAYNALVAKANALDAKIAHNADHTTVVTCKTVNDAKKLVAEWTADYEALRKPTPAPAQEAKPVPAKGKAKTDTITLDGKEYRIVASESGEGLCLMPVNAPKKAEPRKSTKAPARTKGNAFDFTKIKGKTNADKNKALHAMLVSKGMKDSRTAEYQAVWNARPWAK